jgi:hypothetical protein
MERKCESDDVFVTAEDSALLMVHADNGEELLANEASLTPEAQSVLDRLLGSMGRVVRVTLGSTRRSGREVTGVLANVDPEVLQLVVVPVDSSGEMQAGRITVVMMHAVERVVLVEGAAEKKEKKDPVLFSHQKKTKGSESSCLDLTHFSRVCRVDTKAQSGSSDSLAEQASTGYSKSDVLDALRRQGIPFTEVAGDEEEGEADDVHSTIVIMNGLLVIHFPYGPAECSSANEILLTRIRDLLREHA